MWGDPHGGGPWGGGGGRCDRGCAVGFQLRGDICACGATGGSLRWWGPCGGVGGALHGRAPCTGPLCPPPLGGVGGAVGFRAPHSPEGWHSASELCPHTSPKCCIARSRESPVCCWGSLWAPRGVPPLPRANAEEWKSHRPPPTLTPTCCPTAGRGVGQRSPFSLWKRRISVHCAPGGGDVWGVGGGGGGHIRERCCTWGPRGDSRPPQNPLQLRIRGTPGLKSPNVGAELRMRAPHHPHAPPRTPTAPPWGSPPPTPPQFILTLPLQGRPRLAAPACSSASLRSSVGTQRSFKRTSTSFGPPRVPAAPSPCPYGCCSGTRLGTARR